MALTVSSLGHLVAELLPWNDFVAVPGLGSFVARYQPAYLHPVTLVAYPPNRDFAFNRRLTEGDGLLERAVATREDISMQEASAALQSIVRDVQAQLEANRPWAVGSLLSLEVDNEGHWVSTRMAGAHLLPMAFGAEPLALHAAMRQEDSSRLNTLPPNESESVSPNFRKASTRKSWMAAAAVILLVTAVGGWLYSTRSASAPAQQASILPLEVASPSQGARPAIESPVPSRTEEPAPVENPAGVSSVPTEAPSVKEARRPIQSAASPAPVLTPSSEPVTSERFALVAGVFRSEANARKRLEQMHSAGYPEAQLALHKGNMYRVDLLRYSSEDAALDEKPTARQATGEAIWVLAL